MTNVLHLRLGGAKLLVLVVLIAAGGVALAFWRPWMHVEGTNSDAGGPKTIDGPDLTPTVHMSLPQEAKDRKEPAPDPVPADQLMEAYPIGRKVRSVGFVNITGEGENKFWILKGKKHFAYQYRIVAEMEVMDNNGTRLNCDFDFKDIHQVRAVSERKLSLELPSSPILEMVWEQVDERLRDIIPGYEITKKVVQVLDPKLETILTAIGNTFFPPEKGDEITALFDKVSGISVGVEYISGLGVTDIKVLKGKTVPHDDLERLAYNIGILADYFIGTVAEAKVDEEKTIRVEDLVGMLVIGYDMTPRGTLKFAKTKVIKGKNGDEVELEIRGGAVTVAGRYGGQQRTGTIRPISGIVHYLPSQRLVNLATIDWEAGVDWVSEGHLLFGTTGVVNLKMTTYYEAKRLDHQPAAKEGGAP